MIASHPRERVKHWEPPSEVWGDKKASRGHRNLQREGCDTLESICAVLLTGIPSGQGQPLATRARLRYVLSIILRI